MKRSVEGTRLGSKEAHSKNTLERVAEQRILMLSGILLRVGILAAKTSSTLGKEGNARAQLSKSREGGEEGGREVRGKGGPTLPNLHGEAKEVLGRHKSGASIEEEGARGTDGEKSRGG